MSFFKSIFNAISNAGSELLETQQEYADEFARMSDYPLKQAYRNAKAHPYSKGIVNSIARRSALEQECVGRGIIISKQEASQKQQYWRTRYKDAKTRELYGEYQRLIRQYTSYTNSDRNDDSLLKASMLEPQLLVLQSILRERGQSV